MRNDGITLVMANHVDLLPQLRSGFSLLDLRVRRPADFSQCRDTALQEGMAVSDELWRQLRSLANRTLVADSAAARTNAGAGTNDND